MNLKRRITKQQWLTLMMACLVTAPLQAEDLLPKPSLATRLYSQHDATGSYHALGLQVKKAPAQKADQTQLQVILFDTSASQIGEHREQALQVLAGYLEKLPANVKVRLAAVDLKLQPLTDRFVAAHSDEMQTALKTLQNRVPLGASNLLSALHSGTKMLQGVTSGSFLYIGDGMSTARLIPAEQLQLLADQLQSQQIPVHSYAVGPKTDLRLLGSLAQQTGGMVVIDQQNTSAAQLAQSLVAATKTTVIYPDQLQTSLPAEALLPGKPLPLRADRETFYLIKGKVPADASITMQADGQKMESRIGTAEKTKYNFLKSLWQHASRDLGLSNHLAGRVMLLSAQSSMDQQLSQWVEAGNYALKTRQMALAQQIGEQIQAISPDDHQARVFLNASQKVQTQLSAAQQNGAADLQNDLDPRAEPPKPGDSNLIDQMEQLQRINEERLALEVTRTIQLARQAGGTDSDAALSLLKRVLGSVQTESNISPEVRRLLDRKLRSELQSVMNEQERNQLEMIRLAERNAQLQAERRMVDQLLLKEERMEQLIDQVRALLVEARRGNDDAYVEAEAVARAAVDLEPSSGVAASALITSEAAGQLNQAFRLRSLRADRFLETLRQVELSHVPFPDEPPIRWPPAEVWKALTERRRKWASVSLESRSPAETRIQSALNDETETGFIDTPLSDAIEFFGDLHRISIIFDNAALLEEGIDTAEPITLDISGIKLRSALKIMLEPLQLTYIIEDEVMKITTENRAIEKLSTRVYPVGDLVIPIQTPTAGGIGQGLGGVGGFGGQGGLGGQGQFGGGAGGGFGGGQGGGFFSLPSTSLPGQTSNKASNKANNKPLAAPVGDAEVEQLLNRILDQETTQLQRPQGQAFAQIKDPLPQDQGVFDNETIQKLKKNAVNP